MSPNKRATKKKAKVPTLANDNDPHLGTQSARTDGNDHFAVSIVLEHVSDERLTTIPSGACGRFHHATATLPRSSQGRT
jgi:hypothetical protein